MNNEIEAQFLDIDKEEIRKKLEELGAKLEQPEILMKRTIFDLGEHSFARVRDEGSKITMTYKKILDDNSIIGTKEINLTTNDYGDAVAFLVNLGLKVGAKQETRREIWRLDDVELCIDTWPWLPTFLEVEGPNEESVWKTAKALGLNKSHAKFGSVDTTYELYYGVDRDIINLHTPELTFDMEKPDWINENS